MKSRRQLSTSLLLVSLAGLAVILAGRLALARSPGMDDNDLAPAGRLPAGPLPQEQASPTLPQARFERILPADGLSFPTVRAILQDQQGFMWFATASGLNRYDGYEFTVYKSDPGDPTTFFSDALTSIYEDREGNFWIGTSGGVHRLDRASGVIDRSHPLWGRGQIYCIYEDSGGIIWVGHWEGLFGFERTSGEQKYHFEHYPAAPDHSKGLSESHVQAIREDLQGNLWIGTGGGLDRLNRETGTFTHYRHDPTDPTSLGHDMVKAIYQDRQGVLWVGTDGGGLNRFEPSSETFIRYQHDPEDPHSLGDDRVKAILEDSSGTFWVGTANGLDRFDRTSGAFSHSRHDPLDPQSLSDDLVYALYEDHAGGLWVGTANGVSKYNRRASQFTYYQERPAGAAEFGLNASKVLSVYEDREGVLWVGTHQGLNRLDRPSGSTTVYQHDPDDPTSLSSNVVHAIYQDQAGVLWLGAGSGWLEQYDPQTESFTRQHLLASAASVITEDLSGNLWIGTQNQGLYSLDRDRNSLVHYPDDPSDPSSLSHHIVQSIYADRAGAVWVGLYYNGINYVGDTGNLFSVHFQNFRHDPADPNTLSHGRVLSIYQDPSADGVIWIGLLGGGLNRFDQDSHTFTHYGEKDGLPDDSVNCILADAEGFLWLQTITGLSRFDPRSETFHNFDQREGVLSGLAGAGTCLQSQTGEMLFGAGDGLYAFYPEQIQDNQHIPPMVITSMSVPNQAVRSNLLPNEQIQLSYQDNSISFEFAALDFTFPEKNQYAVLMEGLDEDWVYVGTRRYVEYRNLRPGEYVFRVKGSNNDGIWNHGNASVQITVAPPFWETWWFRATMGLVVVGCILGVFRLRFRSIQARSRELAAQVQERTREIERSKQELEALYRADEELYRHLELDQLLQVLLDKAVDILRADKGSLMVWDDRRENLLVQAAHGFSPETVARMSFARGQGVAGRVAVSGEPAIVEDANTDPYATKSVIEAEGIRSFMQVSLEIGGGIFGVFSVDYLQPRSFTDEEQRLLISLAQRAALAIENAQLYGQAQELAVLQERGRLARELHDAVTQTLFSASLLAEALPPSWERDQEEGRQLLRELRQLNRGALAEMRTLLLELRPAALIESDLGDLLHQLAEAVSGREGLPVTVTIEGTCSLPPDVHVALYRIAQEALNNVVKHARAKHVEIYLRRTFPPSMQADGEQGRSLTLSVRDDGRGFDPAKVSSDRLGLGIMAERAEAIGARLTIESQPGQGTQVAVVWEYPAQTTISEALQPDGGKP